MSDQAAFEAHLDQHPDDWSHRMVYADWLRDRGHEGLADAQAWMAKHRKRPVRMGGGLYENSKRWRWFVAGDGEDWKSSRPEFTGVIAGRNGPLYEVMNDTTKQKHLWGHPTRQAAEYALAHALRKAGMTPEPQQMSRRGRVRRYSMPVIENPEGGLNPRTPEEQERASRVDLVTLPLDVCGTNCCNCVYIQDGHCTHPEVNQPVNDRMCCALWDRPGTVRPWKSREGFRQYARVGRRRHRYAAVDESQVHPDWHPDGLAPRAGHVLRHIAGQESQFPESGELATVALAVGPEAVGGEHFTRLGRALAHEGHPLADAYNWHQMGRSLAIDGAIRRHMQSIGLRDLFAPSDLPIDDAIRVARGAVPDATDREVHGSQFRISSNDYFRWVLRDAGQRKRDGKPTVRAVKARRLLDELAFNQANPQRYASYRSPQGGMLARGLYYPGGKFLPGGSGFTGPAGQEQPTREDHKKPKKTKHTRIYTDPVTGQQFGAGSDDPADSTADTGATAG